MYVRSFIKTLLVLGLLTLLPACALLPPSEPSQVYQLPLATTPAARGAKLAVALRIVQPSSVEPISSARIVRVTDGQRVEVYEDARWIAPAPRMLRDYLLDAFIRDGRIAHISHDGDRPKVDYELLGTLNAFQSEQDQQGLPHAVIRLHLQLVDLKRDMIIASRYFEYDQGVAVDSATATVGVDAVVSAFSTASAQMAAELPEWAVRQIRLSRKGRSNGNGSGDKTPDTGVELPLRDPALPPAISF